MASLYARWMHDWETRLASVNNNRVVRPLEWGVHWTRDWPCRNGFLPHQTDEQCERYIREYNLRAVAASDEFFTYTIWAQILIWCDPETPRRLLDTWCKTIQRCWVNLNELSQLVVRTEQQ